MAKVVIAGGGIGGLTAAIALQRHGVEAHVY
jgi:2-polyprenyl-6-methoxyphenol hydroxylase-like FAD-dependent oxidoreductase